MRDDRRDLSALPPALVLLVVLLSTLTPADRQTGPTRPKPPGEQTSITQDQVTTRLWEDPIGAVRRWNKEHAAKPTCEAQHIDASGLKACGIGSRDTVLAVLANDGDYPENEESRRRRRVAVVNALADEGFIPCSEDRLRICSLPALAKGAERARDSSCELPRPGLHRVTFTSSGEVASGLAGVAIAVEQFRRERSGQAECRRWPETAARNGPAAGGSWAAVPELVTVMWIPETALDRDALGKLGALLDKHPHAAVLGPTSSSMLRTMIDEAFRVTRKPVRQQPVRHNGVMPAGRAPIPLIAYSPTADLGELRDVARPAEIFRVLQQNGFDLQRPISNDAAVASLAIAELRARRIDVCRDRVLLLSEWDTDYGRALARSFAHAAETACQGGHRLEGAWYLRGLDGHRTSDTDKDRSGHQAAATGLRAGLIELLGGSPVAGDGAYGNTQLDYARRLGKALAGGAPIAAVGIVGTDLYDKRTLLQVLHSELRNATYFTVALDARLFDRSADDDLPLTMNLVVLSAYGLEADDAQSPGRPAVHRSFRDVSQTSLYRAVRRFLSGQQMVDGPPRVFEIGLRGAVELPPPDGRHRAAARTAPPLRWSWWTLLALVGTATAVVALTSERVGGLLRTRFGWVALGGTVLVTVVFVAITHSVGVLEPWDLGVTIWPSALLRLIAAIVVIALLVRAHHRLTKVRETFTKEFHLQSLPGAPTTLTLFDTVHRWGSRDKLQEQTPFRQLWAEYLELAAPRLRWTRTVLLSLVFLAYGFLLMEVFGYPKVPARGAAAFFLYYLSLTASVGAVVVLTFFITDGARLCRAFLRRLGGDVRSDAPLDQCFANHGLGPEEGMAWMKIELAAKLTTIVGDLIVYPFIPLALMLLARSSIFDDLGFPPGLALTFATQFAIAIGSIVVLEREARTLRERTDRDLIKHERRSSRWATSLEPIQRARAAIAAINQGAFRPWQEHPFIKAAMLPSGSIGVLAVLQHWIV